jgi:hypothetical protein
MYRQAASDDAGVLIMNLTAAVADIPGSVITCRDL